MGSGAADMSDAELVEALSDIEEGLWDRELEFVDDMGRQLALEGGAKFSMSPRQRAWAEDIWTEKG